MLAWGVWTRHGAAVNQGVLFIDLDGTLVGASGIHERVWEPLMALRQAGWRLAVCTGRPGRGVALEVARRLEPEGLHVFESGSAVLDTSGRVVQARTLEPLSVSAVATFGKVHDVVVEAYTEDGRFLVETRAASLVRAHEELLGLEASASPWPPTDRLVRMQWNLPTTRWAALREVARPVTARLSAHEGRSPRMPGVSFISLTPAGVSKATGMAVVLAAYGLEFEHAAMVGDNLNDLDALRLSRRRFVPSTGAPEALALADTIVGSPEEGGVADAALALQNEK